MTREEILVRMAEVSDRLTEIAELSDDDMTDELREEFETLETEFGELEERDQRLATDARIRAAVNDPARVVAGDNPHNPLDDPDNPDNPRGRNPFDLDETRAADFGDLRGRSLAAVEQAQGFTDRDREILTGWVEDLEDDDAGSRNAGSRLMRHIVVTSSPDYVRNWKRAFKTGATRGQPDPEAVGYLSRAMSLTDASGGFAIPQQLDPALILTSDGSTNPIRQISRHVIATGDTWTGLSTTHAAWSNDAEAAEVSDDATTFVQPSIPIHKAQVFIPFSVEIEMDYPGFSEDLRLIIANGNDDLDATNFATGTGTGQPTGIVTALTGGASEVASATTDVFAIADVYAVEEGLAEKYLGRARWTANRAIYNDVRQFDTSGGAGLWERIGNGLPPELLGYAAHVASAMDGVINATVDNFLAILGDWSNYVIADRVGMTLELVPHLFATANNRPSGQRGFYGYARTGADSVNDGGFSMLNVT